MVDMTERLTARARQALSQWGIPDQQPELLKYRENAVFRVSLEDGRPAALRLHRPAYHSQASLESELEWMADLRQQGVDVPEPVKSCDGSLLVALDAGDGTVQYADLIGWVHGRPLGESGTPFGWQPSELREIFGMIGREIAHMHCAANSFEQSAGFVRPRWDSAGLLGDAPVWGRFWEASGLGDDDRAFLADLRAPLRQTLAVLDVGLDQGLIHADLVRENVMLKAGSVAFIDFDDCGHGYRMFEIATVLLRNRREPDYVTIRDSLLAGYVSIRPDIQAQLVHLPLFLLLRSLTYIGWAAARPELADNEDRLRRYVAEARELASNVELPAV